MLPVKYGRVSDHADHLTAGLFFHFRNDLRLIRLVFEINEFDLDEFMGGKCIVSGLDDGLGKAFLPDKHYRIQAMGLPS